MVSHMKTTINIADDLLLKAKRRAQREKKTLREIVEQALRKQLVEEPSRPFRLKRHVMKGKGLQAGLSEGDWEKVRELIYRVG